MSQSRKIRAAQLSALKKYGVLADFSSLNNEQLDRVIKGVVPAKAARDMTFAAWCDQLLGDDVRVPVARFNDAPAGQMRLGNLAIRGDLVKNIKALERQHQASLKAAQYKQGESASAAAQTDNVPLDEPPGITHALRNWYSQTAAPLRQLLGEVKETDGHIFNQQGESNKDYRTQLMQAVVQALSDLEYLDFCSTVEARETTSREPSPLTVMLYRSPTREEGALKTFEFAIEGIQLDVWEAANEYLPSIDKNSRFDCHVRVSISQRHQLSDEELFHLECFLLKLFEATARSSDRRPRGALRETLILCLLLSETAPCMPSRMRLQELSCLRSQHYAEPLPGIRGRTNKDADIPAGKIVDYLLQLLREFTLQ
ncbi:hypothetical protein NK553_14105 [Pseudomonas sp. ZM23]|uniref:Uncharacterized protein n=1 Tax=Pseudomonas triclosanedens TaxID=2961893 RepID=A0ABY7A3G4_9PSED|nr:hypothetical protein [Pseudomonas triclosanedens]MCP8465082.1 hypothetical protein [Pseudomonas triclosanedens]MCP8470206.1 hypothetical protein [Pseudomonas triclosanedens]MCP8476011.1 hypothetical protein [Pseudomonas triclosanedens]WAI51752.1 hypothetical protein OU419_11035 [Pseudomonas triclosanedens]